MKPIHWLPGLYERERMLREIGATTWRDLFRDVPSELILEEAPQVGYGSILSEEELRRLARGINSANRVYRDPPPFTGGGWCPHHVPAVIDALVSRGEFLTAYTPYQPEINQGILQALFEYQSLIADLTELEVVNASLYDGSTALAEAALTALRVTRRSRIIVSEGVHPEYLSVLETWLYGKNVTIEKVEINDDSYNTSIERVSGLLSRDTAAVVIASPNFYGALERGIKDLAELAHEKGALLIQVFEPLSLGIVSPPGRLGVDIAVAEGQPLGLGLNYGGPGLGIMAVRWDRKLLRQLPGRLIGMTRDTDGNRAFTMVLQAREQHIRREKATSNITTNEALMAIRAAIYLSLLGWSGLRRLAETIWLRSHYLAKKLRSIGVTAPVYKSEYFKEFTARFPVDYSEVYRRLQQRGIMAGLPLSRYYPERGKDALFCVTELHSTRDIDLLIDNIKDIINL